MYVSISFGRLIRLVGWNKRLFNWTEQRTTSDDFDDV